MNQAIAYLRRRTVWRSLHTYRVWIGRAIGWWSILYMIFWLVIFGISGAEMIRRSDQPLSLEALGYAALVVAALFLLRLTSGRAPPVVLDRRDLYRLGLAPTVPWQALRYRLNLRRSLAAIAAAVVGGLWSLLAPAYFHLQAPWAAPALALLVVAFIDVGWLRYAGFRRRDAAAGADRPAGQAAELDASTLTASSARRSAAAIALAGALTLAVPAGLALLDVVTIDYLPLYSPLAALASPNVLVLLVPLALALASQLAVRRSLAHVWPPRFAAQSLVLTQLQAMRMFQMLAGLASAGGAREADAAERKRLLDALHDRPGVTRPRRSLRPPVLGAHPWRALAWRSASLLYRRPRWAQVRSILLTLGAVTALFAAAPTVAGVALFPSAAPTVDPSVDALAGATGAGSTFVGAIGVLLAAFLMARAGAGLLGPSTAGLAAPLRAGDRTLGRLAPGLGVIGVLTLIAVPAYLFLAGGAALPDLGVVGSVFLAYAILTLTCLAVLEKYSSWSGAPASRWEPQVVSALVVALPVIVLIAFDAASWILPVQIGLLAIAWILEI